MNLDYLHTYIEVIRLGSFSEVAKRSSISQPAVSFQIQKLERDLGVRLIDRSQKAISMTDAGKRLLIFAKSIEGEWEKLRHDLDQLRDEVTGELIITASTIPGEFLLPLLLGEFKGLHPAIKARVVVSDSLTVIAGVRDGTYEVGFCGTPSEGQELDSFRIGEDEIVLIVFPEHPFADRKEISVSDLEGEPLIFREITSGTQQSIEARLAQGGFNLKKLSPNLVLGSTEAVVSAVEARVGIAFVSSLAIKKSLTLGLVKQVKVSGLKLERYFYCVYRRERIVSRLLAEFIAFAQAKSP
jgi:LysR family transcriptional regulator, low CO2-responsive transcriptional regulator